MLNILGENKNVAKNIESKRIRVGVRRPLMLMRATINSRLENIISPTLIPNNDGVVSHIPSALPIKMTGPIGVEKSTWGICPEKTLYAPSIRMGASQLITKSSETNMRKHTIQSMKMIAIGPNSLFIRKL
jgi:hypothetical protein